MEKCYLFGAGINAYGVIKFIGKKNIIAVVDNSASKIGLEIEGIKIICFNELVENYRGEPIVISAYHARKEVERQLNEQGIYNCVAAPYMQKGYYDSFEEMYERNQLNHIEDFYLYGDNFFAKMFLEVLQKHKKNGVIITALNEAPENSNILLMCETLEKDQRVILDIYVPHYTKHHNLIRFKDIHKGERCFIIGNGPSLTIEDLNVLKENNEICFGSNWIIKAFDKTEWRPNYYVVMDYNFMRIMPEKIRYDSERRTIILHADTFQKDIPEDEYTYSYQAVMYDEEQVRFSEDITEAVFSAFTVTYDMLQIAAYMGFEEIYLLGVDCSNGSQHFYSQDTIDMTKVENSTVLDEYGWKRQYAAWKQGYQLAEQYSRNNHFRIYNATRGGELEVFERVNFDRLFCGQEWGEVEE